MLEVYPGKESLVVQCYGALIGIRGSYDYDPPTSLKIPIVTCAFGECPVVGNETFSTTTRQRKPTSQV